MSRTKKRLISFAVSAALVLVAILYFTVRRNEAAGFTLDIKPVVRGDVQATVKTRGILNPVTVVDVGSQISGLVSALYADYNSFVKQGQLLAELDQAPYEMRLKQSEADLKIARASLAKAKVNVENLQSQYERAKTLFDKALISIEEKETAQSSYLSAKADLAAAQSRLIQTEAQVESAKVDLSYTVIKSPIDGVVIKRAVNVGQTVAARFEAPVLFQIADDLTHMRVECKIREADIGMVRKGQAVTFFVDAYPGVPFNGIINQVRYASEQVQNVVTYTTIVEVDNSDLRLLPGMTANVTIDVGSAQNVLLVPTPALRFIPPPDLAAMIHVDWNGEANFYSVPEEDQQDTGNSRQNVSRVRYERGEMIRSLWIENKSGGIRLVLVRPGLTDTINTQVVATVKGELKEGDRVVVWARTPETEKAIHDAIRNRMMRRFRR
jgi:HlyD family secretion protein